MFVSYVRESCPDICDAETDEMERRLIEVGELDDMCSIRVLALFNRVTHGPGASSIHSNKKPIRSSHTYTTYTHEHTH